MTIHDFVPREALCVRMDKIPALQQAFEGSPWLWVGGRLFPRYLYAGDDGVAAPLGQQMLAWLKEAKPTVVQGDWVVWPTATESNVSNEHDITNPDGLAWACIAVAEATP